MQNILTFTLLLLINVATYAQFNTQADSLLNNRQYFLLNDYVKANTKHLSKDAESYYNAFLQNFFNKPKSSNNNIQSLIKKDPAKLTVKQRIELLRLEISNDLKEYNYKSAYHHSATLLKEYSNDLVKEDIDDINNDIIIWKSLQDIAQQRITLAKDTRIPYKRDLAKLITIPVSFGDYSDDYVFDTGANISVITETNAVRSKMQLMDDYFDVEAITGIKLKARMGVAHEVRIGDVVMKNVIFMVFPDEALSFANGAYTIQGIIGFPVIEQFKEVRISMAGYIDVPSKTTSMPIGNFGLDGLTPVVNVNYKGNMLPFTFDTGAQITLLNKAFFNRYNTEIKNTGKAAELKVGGAGGSNLSDSFIIPELVFQLYDKEVTIKDISVKTAVVSEKENYYYGNMGQDVLKQFDELVINFEYMYVLLKNIR